MSLALLDAPVICGRGTSEVEEHDLTLPTITDGKHFLTLMCRGKTKRKMAARMMPSLSLSTV